MGYFAPTFLAFILNSCGVYIFYESSKPGCEPLVSCLIFLFSVFILLWDIRLFPSSLRKLWRCGAYFLQFLIATFLMEHIMNDFWFPLEHSSALMLPKLAELEKEVLKQGGYNCAGFLSFLRHEIVPVIVSYSLSLFFFFAVLHATRIIDFRLLRCGFGVFCEDIKYRFRKFNRKFKKMFCKPKSVKFQLKHKHRSSRNIEKCLRDDDFIADCDGDSFCVGRDSDDDLSEYAPEIYR